MTELFPNNSLVEKLCLCYNLGRNVRQIFNA